MTAQFTHEEMLVRAHVAIFGDPHWCWLTQVVLLGRRHLVDSIPLKVPGVGEVRLTALPTAATDGYHVWYSKDFMSKAWAAGQDKGVRMLVLHENLHKALRHQTTWRALFEADKQRANYAADVVVNNLLLETPNFCLNPGDLGGVVRPEFNGLSTGEVYDRLENDPQYQQRQQGGSGDGEGDFDWHLGPQDTDGEDDDAQGNERDTQIAAAIQQGLYMQRQKHPQLADRFAEITEPQVDWRQVLTNWMQGRTWGHDLADWRRPSRRSGALGVFLPQHYAERTGRLAIGVDVSGSISEAQLGQFLGEVASLCNTLKPVGVDLVYWDGTVEGVEHYDNNSYTSMATSFAPKGGGSTDPGVFLEWLRQQREDYRGILLMTDGYVPSFYEGQWPADILGVINTNVECPLPHTRLR